MELECSKHEQTPGQVAMTMRVRVLSRSLQGVQIGPWMMCQAVAEGKRVTDRLVLACLSLR